MSEQLALNLVSASVGLVSAIFFCIGNIFNSVHNIKLLATPFWDFSEPIARDLAAQRAQSITGGVLLLIAFCLQIFAQLASPTSLTNLPTYIQTWYGLVLASTFITGFFAYFASIAINKHTFKRVMILHHQFIAQQSLDVAKAA